jgi:hypothetical protein
MVTYYTSPQIKATVGATDYINDQILSASITGIENGFDVATLIFSDKQTANRATITQNAAISVYTKNISDAGWGNPILTGKIRYANEKSEVQTGETIHAKIDGAGYGFAEMLCAQAYGNQSSLYAMNTLKEIITDSTYGIVPIWVNEVLNSGNASGYSYDVSDVDDITGSIRYLYFPYKPASKCVCDVVNLVQAIKGVAAGPHWIVTPAGKLLVTTVASHSAAAASAGWTTYYAGSQDNATLEHGKDFLESSFENQSTQANYVLYHSNWLFPSNGDICENWDINDWDGTNCTAAYATTEHKAGVYSTKITFTAQNIDQKIFLNGNFGLDITKAGGKFNRPVYGFWCMRDSDLVTSVLTIGLHSGTNYAMATVNLDKLLPNADEWAYIEIEIGPYHNTTPTQEYTGFTEIAGFDWTTVNSASFTFNGGNNPTTANFWIDDFHFAGWVIRAASNSTKIAADGVLKTRIINDQFAKDDSLSASDTTGTAAQLCYAELLRTQTNPVIGTVTTPYLPGLYAGQLVHIHARPNSAGTYQINQDFRVTQYTHSLTPQSWTTKLTLTSDLINGLSRASYESLNEANKAIRPEFQDAQATGIKMRDIDITQPILGVDYPS